MSFEAQEIKKDFPILDQQVNGNPLVYLDNAASSQRPGQVIDAITQYYEHDHANVHRGIHTLAERATKAYEGARSTVASFLHAEKPEEIIFVRNATEGFNLVVGSWGEANIREGDEILLTEIEHHANIVPWQQLAQRKGAKLLWLPVDTDTGILDVEAFDDLVTDRTKVFSFTHMSNVLGTIPPVAELVRKAKGRGMLTVVDGAQSAPHLPVDVRALGCDFYIVTAHKLLGPTGIGAVYARWDVLKDLPPYQTGGSMIEVVEKENASWQDPPGRFEAGTPNMAGAIGFAAAIRYLEHLGMDAVREHEKKLIGYALNKGTEVPDMRVYGPSDPELRGGVMAFTVDGVHPHDLGQLLDREGIAIRTGHHCTQVLHRKLDLLATARASFYVYNDESDVDRFITALQKIQKQFVR